MLRVGKRQIREATEAYSYNAESRAEAYSGYVRVGQRQFRSIMR